MSILGTKATNRVDVGALPFIFRGPLQHGCTRQYLQLTSFRAMLGRQDFFAGGIREAVIKLNRRMTLKT